MIRTHRSRLRPKDSKKEPEPRPQAANSDASLLVNRFLPKKRSFYDAVSQLIDVDSNEKIIAKSH